ncbi:hypothetical protein ACFQ7F_32965 [Streptomyces sp. NPDC056486]|uniref:hypothetical protein n=1 Tax=Streptomyces sp. NPDC056486 TaxID=3345835 RepID=UPI0036938D59
MEIGRGAVKALRGGGVVLLLATVLMGCGEGEGGAPDGAAGPTSGGSTAASANSSDGPESTSTTANATSPRAYVAMTVDGELHAMLTFKLFPAGGQVVGKYTLVHFDGSGREVRTKTDFNGRGTGTMVELDGLADYGVVKGTLSNDRTRLTLDRTFGVEKNQWKVVSSKDVFESAVREYAKRFASCSKKKDYNPCEGVT